VIVALAVAWLGTVAHAGPTRALDPTHMPPEIARLYQDKPVIELVTIGAGSGVWERHGHVALCVHHDDRSKDTCYNYGNGDFQHPAKMVWEFFLGTASFWVGKSSVADLLLTYQVADRTIWLQPIPLTREQKLRVIEKLELDVLETNRYYTYDHFWDNCTTRVRDILNEATGGKLSAIPAATDDRTYRDLAREGFSGMHLPLLITDIALSRAADRVPTSYERMFLPHYLRGAVTRLWGIQPTAIYERHGESPPTEGPSGRMWFALAIMLLTSPAWVARLLGRMSRSGLALAIVPYALIGAILMVLAIVSPLPYVRWNESCLVLLPLDVLVLVLSPVKRRMYARLRLAMLGGTAVLALVGVLKQPVLVALLWPVLPLAVIGLGPECSDLDPAGGRSGRFVGRLA
jgi:hypothetical protein